IVDAQYARVMGYELAEMTPSINTWERTIHPDDRVAVQEALERSLASDDVGYDVEYRALMKGGGWAWVNTRGRVAERDANGRPVRMMGTLHDITGRKLAEERIKDALRVNEVLLREVHHRVKNNLAAIASLFYLQARTTTDESTLALLED